MEKEYIDINEAAELLKCNRATVYRILNKKKLDYYRIPMNNKILIKKEDVLNLLEPIKVC